MKQAIIICILFSLAIVYGFNFPFGSNKLLQTLSKSREAIYSGCGNTSCSNNQFCPDFLNLEWTCDNGTCIYDSGVDSNVCSSVSQCGNSTCDCGQPELSNGCKCIYDDECENSLCYNGVCQNAGGFIGEFCTDDDQCSVGSCAKDNTCQFSPNGANCTYDGQCQEGSYCNFDYVCAMNPPCSPDNLTGYCPNYGQCVLGVCQGYMNKTDGMACDQYSIECAVGYACLESNGDSTCQRVPLGTPCFDSADCESMTQTCVCVDPDDEAPMQCSDQGGYKCMKQLQDLINCATMFDCIAYDVMDNTTKCGQNCAQIYYIYGCCSLCEYPELNDNALPNYAGSCADLSIAPVNCCSDKTPCVITTVADICEGYKS